MRVLIVEDDPNINRQLVSVLTAEGYAVDTAYDGEEGAYLGTNEPYDAIILDLGLPAIDGLSVLRKWRRDGLIMPVLILSARGDWSERVTGIDAGADDYVPKPFHAEEVLARIRALIRRGGGRADNEIVSGDITIDFATARVTRCGAPIRLTSLEYRVLAYMVHNRDKIISRTELIEHIYNQDFDRDSNTIEVFIARLRRKLGSHRITTERGLGYRWVDHSPS